MKVLWFADTSSMYKNDSHPYHGCGWIKSLEQLIIEQSDIKLGVSFFHPTEKNQQENERITYYPLLRKKKNSFYKLINNWSCRIEPERDVERYMSVINEFKPDVVHIFGTEGPFAIIQKFTNIPVVIHLQGLICPYFNAYYPSGISSYNILFESSYLKKNLLGNSLIFDKKRFAKQATREQIHFKNSKYLMGRTKWDKSISELLAPQAAYFHVDEVLRPIFYRSAEWFAKQRDKVIIVSTISNTIYKGFDLILKTAKILKENTSLLFEWQIAGLKPNSSIVSFFENELKIKCKDCNVMNIGVMNSDQLVQVLSNADIFVHPSYIDNSPNSLCEAQILGIPVIACNVGGIASLIENEVSGILIPANDPYELAMKIKTLATDKMQSAIIGKQGRRVALIRHNPPKILADLLDSYNKILYQR